MKLDRSMPWLAVLAAGACRAAPPLAEFKTTHPASPLAAEAPQPRRSTVLDAPAGSIGMDEASKSDGMPKAEDSPSAHGSNDDGDRSDR